MPRIKTKGNSLAFRLPEHLDVALRETAAERHMTPAQWCIEQLSAILEHKPRSRRVAVKAGGADPASAAHRMVQGLTGPNEKVS